MQKLKDFDGCLVLRTKSGLTWLADGPDELTDLMDGECFDDNCLSDGRESLPTEKGLFRATVEYWFEQGYMDGYPAPGESDIDFILSNLQRIINA